MNTLITWGLGKGSLWLLFFCLGFMASQTIHQYKQNSSLAKGQKVVIEYKNVMDKAVEESNSIVSKAKTQADGDIAPVMREYLNLLWRKANPSE